MITIKNITAKNFLSIGNQTQAVDFSKEHLTLVLGTNLDLGGDDTGSRNGTGKSTILNALSYALYGQALTNIKKDNLVNNINAKHMLVTVEFEKNHTKYRIERGRKPNVLKFFVNNTQLETKDDDDSQGDSRETQKTIDSLLGLSHTMFKHIVALNTYTEPFLSMRAADQREIIEQLLGITILSEKAEQLKVQIKDSKDQIQQEQYRIEGIKTANENVQKSINNLKLKGTAWKTKHDADLESISKAIMHLENVNIEQELKNHELLKIWSENNKRLKDLVKQRATLETALMQAVKSCNKYVSEIEKLKTNKCPACEQDIHSHKHVEMLSLTRKNLEDANVYSEKLVKDLGNINNEIEKINNQPKQPITFYDTDLEAQNHKNNLEQLEKSLILKADETDPYEEQIEDLKKTAIQELNWDTINKLSKIKEHQEFLHKLLTNKDSFVRKKIIDQNLSYLNKRLSYYIDKLGLPHRVVFQNDLTVEITQLGQDLDFDNLSRGERNRLILSLSFAFRDVWEGLYQNINLLFIDEMIDSGMDTAGVELALSILKKIARDREKNIYLISHRDELVGRVNSVLRVIKESGFTNYSSTLEYD